MKIETLNQLESRAAYEWFYQTCSSENWCQKMVSLRPYQDINAIKDAAQAQWEVLERDDLLEAFAGHPMIGDLSSLKAKFSQTKAMASNEQASTAQADESVLLALQRYNHDYLDKHGFIFIICATGLSAQFMLDKLKSRIDNSTDDEINNAANEQIKITLLRIQKGLEEGDAQL